MGFQLMFDQAISFDICGSLCKKRLIEEPARNELYLIPMVVNLSFACELYIKTLLEFLRIPLKKEHYLDDLYNLLPQDVHNSIESAWNTQCLDANQPFDVLLTTNKNAYYDLRYCYEQKESLCAKYFFTKFSKILREECCQRIYGREWKAYCKTAEIELDL